MAVKTSDVLIALAALVGVGFAFRRRPLSATAVETDTRKDTSSFGPVEHVGPIGNTDPGVLLPRPGEGGNIDTTLPWLFGPNGCQARSIGDFHPDCFGVTFDAFTYPVAGSKPLSATLVRQLLLDPSRQWYGKDRRLAH